MIKRIGKILKLALLLCAITSCSQQPQEAFTLVSDDGTKYLVYEKQNLIFNGEKMLVLTYLSSNPYDKNVREKEFEDLYQITADNIAIDNGYDFVALVALEKEKETKFIGVSKNSGYRDRRRISEVMKLRKNEL